MNTDALNQLNQFTGTEHHWRLPLHGGFYYTDGVRYLAQNADCYWLLDLIASYQPQLTTGKDARLHDMQFWNIKAKDGSAVVTCRADSDVPPAVTQEIGMTDFPLADQDVWVCRDEQGMVALLKSEY